jgi:pSer/pThr/pTyr-binding forkhead associated (FHA) protein
MRAKLFCKHGIMKGKSFEFESEATIGRGERNDITLNSKEVSKEHARIVLDSDKGCYFLEDSSTNGTQLDGMKVYEKERLGHLHVITFANLFDFIFLDTDLCKKRFAEQPGNQPSADKKPEVIPVDEGSKQEDETLMEQDPLVLPGILGQGKHQGKPPIEEGLEEQTMMEEKPFILPTGLGQKKKETNE